MADVTNWQSLTDNPIATVLKQFLDPSATASPGQYPVAGGGINPGYERSPGGWYEIPPTEEQAKRAMELAKQGENAPLLSQVIPGLQPGQPHSGPPQLPQDNTSPPGMPGNPFPVQSAQPGQPQQGAQHPDWQQMVLDALRPQQQREKTWGDTGKELMAPLAVGLLSSLVHPYYGGGLSGLKQGIDAGVGLWSQQRVLDQQSRNAAQRNQTARAGVLAKMGQSEAMERLRQAQMEQTGELTRSRIAETHESNVGRREDAQQREADRVAIAAQASADRQYAQQMENRRAADSNAIRVEIAQMKQGPGGLKDKYISGTFTSPRGLVANMKASDLDDPSRLYAKDAAEFNKLGEKEKAAAVQDERVQPLLYQKKSAKDLDNETTLINGNATLSGLDRQVKDLLPKKGDNPEEAAAFLAGKHEGMFGGKPLQFKDVDPMDSPEVQAQKAKDNEVAKRGWIKRYIDYMKYKGSYTDGMEPKLADLLNNVGIARQQAASAAMVLTGSRAFGQQMQFFGTHIPNYTDPPALMLDKIKNLQASYNRALFQAGRFNAIPKDKFGPTYQRFLQDQGLQEGQQSAPTSAPAAAPTGGITVPDSQLP